MFNTQDFQNAQEGVFLKRRYVSNTISIENDEKIYKKFIHYFLVVVYESSIRKKCVRTIIIFPRCCQSCCCCWCSKDESAVDTNNFRMNT